jgi:hypothetical protein
MNIIVQKAYQFDILHVLDYGMKVVSCFRADKTRCNFMDKFQLFNSIETSDGFVEFPAGSIYASESSLDIIENRQGYDPNSIPFPVLRRGRTSYDAMRVNAQSCQLKKAVVCFPPSSCYSCANVA